jgi:hypothetical protein
VKPWPLKFTGVLPEEAKGALLGGLHLVKAGGQPYQDDGSKEQNDEQSYSTTAGKSLAYPIEKGFDACQDLVQIDLRLGPLLLKCAKKWDSLQD